MGKVSRDRRVVRDSMIAIERCLGSSTRWFVRVRTDTRFRPGIGSLREISEG